LRGFFISAYLLTNYSYYLLKYSINLIFVNNHYNQNKKFKIMEGYCVKCKAKKEIKDGAEVTMKNGRKAMKGKCPTCGTGMFRILGKA